MKDYRITIEPISPEAKQRSMGSAQSFECESLCVMASSVEASDAKGKLVNLQAAILGPRQLIAHSIFALLKDESNTELRHDLAQLMLKDMLGTARSEVVERHQSCHGMPDTPEISEELLAALFGPGRRTPHN